MIASLMMYQRPELAAAHDRLWSAIRDRLRADGIPAPKSLSQDAEEFSVWRDPELVLSQTCGMPYRLWLHGQVSLVGTPDYGLDACPPGHYRSALVVRADDPREQVTDFANARFAYNQTFSQSGFAAPFWHLHDHGFFFQDRLHTGAHLASARAVADGTADIASLDAVTWRNIERFDPFAPRLRVLAWTAPTPGLPLITSASNDAPAITRAVHAAIDDLSQEDKDLLGLKGLVSIPKENYLAVPNPPGTAELSPPI
ncbi:phosphate/phosphite/phosphonate ABC transporter substrate-binding protein [Gymnodinialimonas ceratoperidinii]|uniref:PhnD/SsuA/transferrin family substrate-binding protein n=1 Tax=Gymnodinialimonas ceratoperidinii TaxID=2856823 RepID=A0A8F6TXR3_9RHOB|nr:PhnD/SsuA/transferrin family substrate-binding protein [Gymnodinialimonas ceratoperidinii]QXT40650.1 PhnD/SsuA/transferrin family substrate-binding protein [Gymnodinialimonas ceratoperidinii]